MSRQTLHVGYVSNVRSNPYVRLLAAGVAEADPSLRISHHATLTWRLLANPWHPDILHLHWVELQYCYGDPPRWRAEWDLRSLMFKLRLARGLGVRLVYTVHNLNQHEGRFGELNARANRWLFAHAHAIHVHSQAAAAAVRSQFGRAQGVHVIPHGNYVGAYANSMDRQAARARLHIPPEHYVYLSLGRVRPYKGLDQLLDAFTALHDHGATLIIAGYADVPDYASQIERRVNGQANVRFVCDYIPDDDLQVYFNAADACVLPYRQVTTSGAALLAYSFGKPIVAPALGPFTELVTGHSGVLFQPGAAHLVAALRRVRALDPVAARSAALAQAAAHDWAGLGAQHAAMYRSLT